MTNALIMAGGRSERMRASAGPLHKALVPVAGVPMIERNLSALLSQGFDRIVVAVSTAEPAIAQYLDGRGKALANACGASLRILWEVQPLGTIGAAREAIEDAGTLLVVNVDNLTSLGLQAFVRFHQRSRAALTVAAHQEPFQIPFGELELCDGRVEQYIEKPVKRIWISSGTYVLEREACLMMPAGRRTDAPQLISALLAAGKHVAAFRHEAAWIDVNQAASVERAEQLIGSHFEEFEWWRQPFDCQVAGVLLRSPAGILLERRAETASEYPGLWHIPGGQPRPRGCQVIDAPVRTMFARVQTSDFDLLTSFDDLDTFSGRLIRHHIFLAEAGEQWRDLHLDQKSEWIPLEGVQALAPRSPVLIRALAALARRECENVSSR